MYSTARLRAGVTRSAADAELQGIMRDLARTDSARYERTTVRTDHTRGVNAELRLSTAAASGFLMGMVALVLLVACANVANLLLGRAASRHTEIGVRLSLGASRNRIVAQLLTESLLLAIVGTVIGLAATFAFTRGLAGAIPPEAGIDAAFFSPDARVLLFTAVMCLITTLLFGLVPALRAASPQLVPMLKGELQTGARRRQRGGLLATQAALSVLLLAIGALFWRSLGSLRDLDPGFRVANVVDVPVDLSLANANEAAQQHLYTNLLERVSALPGVQSAAMSAHVPLTGSSMETPAIPDGRAVTSRFDMKSVHFNVVTPGYFETLDIPLQQGRAILSTDGSANARVVVVNETAAKRWWPGESAVGKRLRWGSVDGPLLEVIGVARDSRYVTPGESPLPFVYLPLAQSARADMVMHVQTSAPVSVIRDELWSVLRGAVPTLPPPPVTTVASDISITLLPIRAGSALLGALGVVALLLAAAGIYGVTAYAVARRTREIGIRAALGASHARLLRMVVRESLRPVAIGLAIGLTLSLVAAFGLSRVLYGIRGVDPVVLPGVTLVLLLVAVAASLAPAWRAASVDPASAIRAE